MFLNLLVTGITMILIELVWLSYSDRMKVVILSILITNLDASRRGEWKPTKISPKFIQQLSNRNRRRFWFQLCHNSSQWSSSIFINNIADWNCRSDFHDVRCDASVQSTVTFGGVNASEHVNHWTSMCSKLWLHSGSDQSQWITSNLT